MRQVMPGTPGQVNPDERPVYAMRWRSALTVLVTGAALAAGGSGAAMASAATGSSAAVTCTSIWVGGAPKVLWNEAKNWSTGRVPGTADNVCVSAFVFVTAPGTITVHSLQVGGESTIIFNGTAAQPSHVTIATTLDNHGNVELDNSSLDAPQVNNQNGIESQGASVLTSPALVNNGDVVALAGRLKLVDRLAQLSNGTLNGGSWDALAGGTLMLPGDVTSLPSGELGIGQNSAIADTGGHGALTGLTSVGPHGSLQVTAGALSLADSLVSSGTLGIGSYAGSAVLNVAGTVTLDAGTLAMQQQSTLSASTVLVSSGSSLAAAGTIAGDLVNDGSVGAASQVHVTGNYTQGSRATLQAGFTSELTVAGHATLAGALLAKEAPSPRPGTQATAVTFASLQGGFTSHNLGVNVAVKANEIDVTAQPQIAASAPSVAGGGPLTITGGDFGTVTTVTVYLDKVGGTVLGTARADVYGNFVANVTIPSATAPGSHLIIARGSDGRRAQTTITVT